MIDWGLTKEKLGITSIDGYRPKVMCRCDGCNKPQIVTIRVKSKVIDNQMKWECHKCVGRRPEVRERSVKARAGLIPVRQNACRRYYETHKDRILKKASEKRSKQKRLCKDCGNLFDLKKFYVNNTYVAKYCLECEHHYKLKRDREVSLYRQNWNKLNNPRKQAPVLSDTFTLFIDSTNIPLTWKYPIWSDYELKQDFERIINYKPTGNFKQTTPSTYGYKIVKHFHKSFWHSTPENCQPVTEIFKNPNELQKCLNASNDNRRISYCRLLREIYFRTKYKYPSIFATHLAIEILHKHCNKGDVVYDPCAGWGNRWLASLNKHLDINYHCSEPNVHIRQENKLIANFFNKKILIDDKAIGDGPPKINADIVFTSPPWSNTEIYYDGKPVSETILDDLLDEIIKSIKPTGKIILHLPNAPESWPKPFKTFVTYARGRYRSAVKNQIFVWKAQQLRN